MKKRSQAVEVAYWTKDGNECVTAFNSLADAIEYKRLEDHLYPGFIVKWFVR